jgi:hypothetical protein
MKQNKKNLLLAITLAVFLFVVISLSSLLLKRKDADIETCKQEDGFCKKSNSLAFVNKNSSSKYLNVAVDSKNISSLAEKDNKALCDRNLMCEKYFDIWKKEQLSRNKYSVSYFTKHIYPKTISLDKWDTGESFRIDYTININDILIQTHDSFLVKLNPNEDTGDMNFPRNTYLDKKNVSAIIDNLAFNSEFTLFKPVDNFYFETKEKALEAITAELGDGFEFSEVRYKSDFSNIENPVRVPILTANNNSKCATENKRKTAYVNLETGTITTTDDVCGMS